MFKKESWAIIKTSRGRKDTKRIKEEGKGAGNQIIGKVNKILVGERQERLIIETWGFRKEDKKIIKRDCQGKNLTGRLRQGASKSCGSSLTRGGSSKAILAWMIRENSN